ncbi:hypothetical protein L6164_032961 [Bauhinia variegata]|uniref:Uncharacterized protein n=1 Tax=Bauhinia variegata TaxID=167791 RepID=A0ACB9KQH5_BAUVA|nr:hypothetical protein L6164_032961 [Bauhinia variegata]
MDSRQLANAETGASMAFSRDWGTVFQGNYNDRREGTTNHFHAPVVYYYSPNRQIQDGGARAQGNTDYANPPSHRQSIPIPFSREESYDNSSFRELIRRKCEVCQQFIPRKATGLIECRRHSFWSQKYCLSHEHDNTARCCSCERLVSL